MNLLIKHGVREVSRKDTPEVGIVGLTQPLLVPRGFALAHAVYELSFNLQAETLLCLVQPVNKYLCDGH